MTLDDFLHLVDRAIGARGAPDLFGKPSITLCGVAFWRDHPSGAVSHADTEDSWDTEAMIAELSVLLAPQSLQERAARQAGWIVQPDGRHWRYCPMNRPEAVSRKAFASESAAWQAICDAHHLLSPAAAKEVDPWERIAHAAGYRVHSWDAVENGDEADTYYWAPATAAARTPELVDLFPTETLAWRDCCISQNLLRDLYARLTDEGVQFARNTMGNWTWLSGNNPKTTETRFETLADAVMDCLKQRENADNSQKVSFDPHKMTQTTYDSSDETVSVRI